MKLPMGKIKTTLVYPRLLTGFGVFAAILLAITIYFILTKTKITIIREPQDVTQELNVEITAEPTAAGNELSGLIQAITVSGTKEFTNSSSGELRDDIATGTVTIYNNWNQDQPLAATTRLLTPDGILFRIKNRVDVPAGGKIDGVDVYADQPGANGDIGPVHFTIPGLWAGLQDKIYAESDSPMTGGVRSAKAITQEIINDAENALKNELLVQALAEAAAIPDAAAQNVQDAVQASSVIIKSTASSAQTGDELEKFSLEMEIEAIIVTFDETEIKTRAVDDLQTTLADDEMICDDCQPTLVHQLTEYSLSEQTAKIKTSYTLATVPKPTHPMFNREKLTSKTAEQIQEYFSSFSEIKQVEIKFSPFWANKSPRLKEGIQLIIK